MSAIQLEWGAEGVRRLARECAVLVIVDVLSFTTAVEVAVSRGAVVYPYPARDDSAQAFAQEHGAVLAGSRREDGFSLSPASLTALPAGMRLVLPSPNGATLTLLAGGAPVVAGCLRNAAAAARAARAIAQADGRPIGIVPAGERWPDGSLRPALEDWLGAGAVIASLAGERTPEAAAAEASFRALQADLPGALAKIPSGQELIERGFAQDVALAAEWNAGQAAPVLSGGAFRPAQTD
ncbi:MAG TPA: 2-phosphosulfolactate phosphatase [Anaerolineaceae bacterium]|nr:2-phosphosulfolactate phosphatase [Anaerolineaceae bacterium]